MKYDHVVILSEKADENEKIKRDEEFYKNNNIEIKEREYLGTKKLAYPVKGENTGKYLTYQLDLENSKISVNEIDNYEHKDKDNLKYISFRADEEYEEYSEPTEDAERMDEYKDLLPEFKAYESLSTFQKVNLENLLIIDSIKNASDIDFSMEDQERLFNVISNTLNYEESNQNTAFFADNVVCAVAQGLTTIDELEKASPFSVLNAIEFNDYNELSAKTEDGEEI